MKNVQFTVKGDKLIITVDLNKEFGPSKSGQTIVIASTQGNVLPPGVDDESIRVGVNVYKYPPEG